MRLAISISPSRVSSSTEPISRMYMRTGSVVRPNSESTVESACFRLLDHVFIGNHGRRGLVHQQGFGIRRLVVDLDAHVVDHADDIFDLLGIQHVVREMVVDLGVGEIAAFLAEDDQVFQAHAPGFSIDGLSLRLFLDLIFASFSCHIP